MKEKPVDKRIVALLPMRHQSERVPGKNRRDFAGRPLYEHVLETLLGCPSISEVVINTDSPAITHALAQRQRVTVHERPGHLCGGEVSMNEVLLHDVGLLDADVYLQTHATNPLLEATTVEGAIAKFFECQPHCDSLFTVTRLQTRLWDQDARPLNHDPGQLLRTQDLPPVFEENSCLYLFTKESIERDRNRIGERPQLFEIAPREAMDIDTEWDFRLAELVHSTSRTGDRQR